MSIFDELDPPYGTIVVDPPWRYTNNRGTQTRSRAGRSSTVAEGNYSTMGFDEIAALPVGDLAADRAHLYLWTTNPCLFGHENRRRGIGPVDILEGWGFTYVTLLTWVKSGPPGMGFYFRGHTEHVLFGRRGSAGIPAHLRESNVIESPRRGHSEKPGAFYDLVERVSPGPWVDLFNRQPRFGWDTWGHGYETQRATP